MTGRLGRVQVGGSDRGAGFALGPRLVVTAHHVVRDREDKPVAYVPARGMAIEVERVQPDSSHDAAILWLACDVDFLPTGKAVRGARWRVESPPPGGNDPPLHGAVTTARVAIQNASGQPVEAVQLEVGEQLGDFGGYSGSAVLDALGRAVLALLVEQKPLRTPVALGEPRVASNVLYAMPIGDVITALGLPVRAARPMRFDVGLLSPGMVARPGLLDKAVSQVIGTKGGDAGARLVVLRGPGGVGKTVLARQLADDVRVWAEFPDGILTLRAGQTATADGVVRQLQEALGYRDRALADVLDGQRLLLIVDDVWDRELMATLQAGLPPAVTILATTRGAFVPRAVGVPVGAVGREEAIQILARDTPRSSELDRALGDLADTLFRWALLLNLAAAEIHRDDELGWELGDADNPAPRTVRPDTLIGRSDALRADFPADPTMLDDLERASEGAAPRSVDVLVRRSLEWLGPEHQARFELLVVYPPGGAITQPMLEDLWQKSPNAARKEVKLLVRAGLAHLVRTDRPTIALHDLITAWLNHTHGQADDPRHQQVHQRLAGLGMHADDDSPGELTRDRAEWLTYHLVSAGAWERLTALPTLRWRSAFLVATGSDAVFLTALDHYARAARAPDHEALYNVVRTWLFAPHVRALIGALPIRTLVAMAVVGEPIAGITQACQHPEAGWAVPAVLAAVADRLDTHLLEQAMAVAETIPDDRQRSEALAAIAGRLAEIDPAEAAVLFERAVAVAEIIPRGRQRSEVLAGVAGRLAGIDRADRGLLERAVAVAESIPDDKERSEALAGVARRLAEIDPAQAAVLFERAVAVAETIPDDKERSEALAGVARRLAEIDPAQAAVLFERALAMAETIPGVGRGWALAGITWRLTDIDPAQAAVLFERAVAVAETIPDDFERGQALVHIALRLAGVDPADPELLERAVAVAEIIPSGWERGRALAHIVERLADIDPPDPGLLERALAVAEIIPNYWERGRALAGIAEALTGIDPSQAVALLEWVLAVADTIPFEEAGSRARAGIAERLAGIDPAQATALFERAAAAADSSAYHQERSEALARVAERLAAIDPAQAMALFDRAVAVAETIPDDQECSEALAHVAERLAAIDPADPGLLERAVAVAETIPDDLESSETLAHIAQALAGVDPPQALALLKRALAVAKTIPDHDGRRSWAMADLAGRVAAIDPADPVLLERAVAVAETIPGDRQRSEALAGIAEALANVDPSQAVALFEQALAVANGVPEVQDERSGALAGVVKRLADVDPADSRLLERAVAVAETIPHPGIRNDALSGIAVCLAGIDPADSRLLERAVAVAETIPPDWGRSAALAGIAGRLAGVDPVDPALLERAVAMAETIPYPASRSAALAGIAGRLSDIDPAQAAVLFERAVAVAETIPGDRERGEALAGIAGRLADIDPSQATRLLERAVAVAETIKETIYGEDGRGWALADIAERLAGTNPRVPALIDQAVAVAETIPNRWRRSCALDSVAKGLAGVDPVDPALFERAVAVAETIPHDERRCQALAHIVWRLADARPVDPALLERALAVANTIPDSWKPDQAVARIHALNRNGMLDELSRWRHRSLSQSIDLVSVFLRNSHDKATAEMIGLAVLHVANEFST